MVVPVWCWLGVMWVGTQRTNHTVAVMPESLVWLCCSVEVAEDLALLCCNVAC